jgi:PAP2 superfamily
MLTKRDPIPARWSSASLVVIREHRVLIALVASYVVGIATFHWAAGEWHHWFILLLPARVWHGAVATSALLLGIEALVRRGDVDLRPRRVLSAVLVLLLAAPFQSTFHAFKQTLNVVRPFTWDPTLSGLDRWLHAGRQPWEWLAPLVASGTAVRTFDWLYFAWLPLLFGFLVWLAWTANHAVRMRALVTLVLLWIVLGTGFAYALSSAGPCFYHAVHDQPDFGGLMDSLHAHHRVWPVIAVDVQYYLWIGFREGVRMPFGGISAMPSLHVAVVTLMTLVALRVHRVLGVAFAVYALAILVGSVVLGWHYAVDGYFSIAATLVLWTLVGWLSRD